MKTQAMLPTRPGRRHLVKLTGALGLGGLLAGATAQTTSAHALLPARPSVAGTFTTVNVHGNAGVVRGPLVSEFGNPVPSYLSPGQNGLTVNGSSGSLYWVLYSIPTPVILDDVRPVLNRVEVGFEGIGLNSGSVIPSSAQIWDRNVLLMQVDGITLEFSPYPFLLPKNTIPLFGVSVALGFTFPNSGSVLIKNVTAFFHYYMDM